MSERRISHVHGHSLQELERLVSECWTASEDQITIFPESSGGWTDINLRLEWENNFYIAKLPGLTKYFEKQPFTQYFNIMNALYPKRISPEPVFIGRLADQNETPFLIYKYVEGVRKDRFDDFDESEILLVKKSHGIFSQQRDIPVPSFSSPLHYLNFLHAQAHKELEELDSVSPSLGEIVVKFDQAVTRVSSQLDNPPVWDMSLTHGDFHEPNILLQENNSVFLDFEVCFYGCSLFDIAYLHTQRPNYDGVYLNPLLISHRYEEAIRFLEPLALISVVGWSIRKSAEIELGIVEENLSWLGQNNELLNYINEKMNRLSILINEDSIC